MVASGLFPLPEGLGTILDCGTVGPKLRMTPYRALHIFVEQELSMNIRSILLVRSACLLFVMAWAFACAAQGNEGGLTKDFDKLSPKERTKIAARETQEAAADSGYQVTMREADQAFQAGRYEDALAAFQRARTMRPYNVYPKVKIEDLQALIKKKEREEAEKAASAPSSVTPSPTPEVKNSAAMVTATPPPPTPPVKAPEPPPIETASEPMPLPKPLSEEQRPAATRPEPESPPLLPGQRVYMEAGAVVTERTVDNDGKLVVYKKVAHSWGQTFYFKDGLAISAREWGDRFSE